MTVYLPENLRDMRLFVAVYEERSFTAAAVRESATQPGVSQHISKLEQRLGARLFWRTAGAVTPTPAGEAFYAGCLEVMRAVENVRTSLRPFESGLEGEITFGLTPTMARCVPAPALARFVEAHPNVVVKIIEAYSSTITEMVRSGKIDLAIVPAMPNDDGVRGKLFARTPEFLVAGHETGRRLLAAARAGDFEPLKLVLPSTSQARRALLDRYFATTGMRIQRRLEMDSMFGTLDFVATTEWATILPGIMMAGERDLSRFVIVPLQSPELFLDLVRIEATRGTPPAAATILFEFIETETDRLLDAMKHLASPHG